MKPFARLTISILFLASVWATATLFAMEKDGLRVEIVPKVVADRSAYPSSFSLTTEVDEDMSLKATIRNVSMKDSPESTIDYVVIVQRWDAERSLYNSYKGSEKLQALRFGEQVEVDIGNYHLGGHLHGNSPQHKDKLAAWKIVVNQGGKTIELVSASNFDSLNKVAEPAHDRKPRR